MTDRSRRMGLLITLMATFMPIPSLALPGSGGAKQAKAATAAAPSLRASYDACMQKANTTTDMLGCSRDEYAFQDERLNDAYKRLMSSLSETKKASLRTEERKWIDYKTKHCKPPVDGGTLSAVTSSDCAVKETPKRAAILEQRLPKDK